MYNVYILPIAKKNIKNAADWYDLQLPGLGKRYRDAVREKTKRIKVNPYLYSIAYANMRTAVVPIFPYVIYYYINEESKRIFITAVPHTSQQIQY